MLGINFVLTAHCQQGDYAMRPSLNLQIAMYICPRNCNIYQVPSDVVYWIVKQALSQKFRQYIVNKKSIKEYITEMSPIPRRITFFILMHIYLIIHWIKISIHQHYPYRGPIFKIFRRPKKTVLFTTKTVFSLYCKNVDFVITGFWI